MKIVLFEPQIPQNTGNIARTCAVSGASLALVRPLGFSISSRYLKRAGLDYWDDVDITTIDDFPSYLANSDPSKVYFFSSHATKSYTEANFAPDSILVFGSETSGLPKIYHENWPENFYTIPMRTNARCLNLASSVAVALYEALRQQNFASMRS